MSEYISPRIVAHLRNLARDVAYTEGHASVMRAAANRIEALEARLDRVIDDSTLIEQFARIIGSAVYGEPDNLSRATEAAEAVLTKIRAVAADEQEAGR